VDCLKFFDGGSNKVLSSQVLSISPPIATATGKDLLRKANALLRFHFKVDPEQLSDEQFSELWQQLKWALHFESKRFNLKDGKNTLQI